MTQIAEIKNINSGTTSYGVPVLCNKFGKINYPMPAGRQNERWTDPILKDPSAITVAERVLKIILTGSK